ncbi:MAG: hypothetical protein DCC67_04345 [Planctomycetota bacterium]|nr:MAG: hypothetical protein DCC67_04345 [Planctomycetota bacterium]
MRKSMMATLVAVLMAAATQASAQNLLANAGFEDPTSTTTSDGNWFRFASGGTGFSEESTAAPHGGSRHIDLQTISSNAFAGVFQKLPVPVSPGQKVIFEGWHKSVGPFNGTVELKIEWAGAPQNRVDLLALGETYESFMHMATAPAGVTGATITYAISSFGAGQSDIQVHIDDFSARVIPEPSTIGLAGLGLLGLVRMRRRK